VKTQIIAANGSIQKIKQIPDEIKNLYKTVWEIPQKKIINLAISRAPFIDQSQSLNIHLSDPSTSKVSSMHFYAWKNGLKTGMYYFRSRPAVDAIKFTLNVEELLKATDGNDTDKILKCMDKTGEESTPKDVVKGAEQTKTVTEEPEGCKGCDSLNS
jgi:ribonucleotide reductase alpha subunit